MGPEPAPRWRGPQAVSHVSVPRLAACTPTRQPQLLRHPSQYPMAQLELEFQTKEGGTREFASSVHTGRHNPNMKSPALPNVTGAGPPWRLR